MTTPTEALASLDSRIMNLRVPAAHAARMYSGTELTAYREGHRDARHAAAELVGAALAQTEQPRFNGSAE